MKTKFNGEGGWCACGNKSVVGLNGVWVCLKCFEKGL
jgi:hypothetical protein